MHTQMIMIRARARARERERATEKKENDDVGNGGVVTTHKQASKKENGIDTVPVYVCLVLFFFSRSLFFSITSFGAFFHLCEQRFARQWHQIRSEDATRPPFG